MRILPVLLACLAAGGCASPHARLERAEAALERGKPREARKRFVSLVGHRDRAVHISACRGAAAAARALRDLSDQVFWLERAAADPPVQGASEFAYVELADALFASGDRSRALNFYYRAAAATASDGENSLIYKRAIRGIAYLRGH